MLIINLLLYNIMNTPTISSNNNIIGNDTPRVGVDLTVNFTDEEERLFQELLKKVRDH